MQKECDTKIAIYMNNNSLIVLQNDYKAISNFISKNKTINSKALITCRVLL